ncbi:hypothetical protein AB0J14_05050 [Micromonospora arborensis]|uniref:hypothetical protein n=1 Tax=Micromonospora arborensis TaxID=2116518 RepID=UPI0033D0D674
MAAVDRREAPTQDGPADLIRRAEQLLEPAHRRGPWSDGSGDGYEPPTPGDVSRATAYALIAIARQMPAPTVRPLPRPIRVPARRPATLWETVLERPVEASVCLFMLLLSFAAAVGIVWVIAGWAGN